MSTPADEALRPPSQALGRIPRRIAAGRRRRWRRWRQPQRTAWAASRQLAVALPGCNRWRCVATDGAGMQQVGLCVCVCISVYMYVYLDIYMCMYGTQRLPHWQRRGAVANAPDSLSPKPNPRVPFARAVLPSLCTAGWGDGGGPHGGTPVPNRYPKHKTAGSPRGSTTCSVLGNR